MIGAILGLFKFILRLLFGALAIVFKPLRKVFDTLTTSHSSYKKDVKFRENFKKQKQKYYEYNDEML